jgi:hypothetical protein
MSEGLHPGKRLRDGRYRLLSKLRAGATAQVWRALDARDGVEVAIKAVPTDAGGADAVEHEAEAVARVQHPGAVRVLATFEEADHGLIVMELAAGSLADRVDAHGPLDGAATRAIGLALAEVLAAAHAAGVVHRDVKPQNVLILRDGGVRLADFGIARVHARGHTRTGALLGTLPFMAPEQRRDARDVRPATDIYALAALIAWMRTGVMPGDLFVPEVIDALRARLLAAGEPDDALLDVIVAAGRYAPAERIADGARMAEALRGVGARDGVVVAGVQMPTPEAAGISARGEEPALSSAGSTAGAFSSLSPILSPILSPGLWGGAALGVVGSVALGLAAYAGLSIGRLPADAPVSEPVAGPSAGASPSAGAAAGAAAGEFPDCADRVSEWVGDVRLGPRETMDAALADVDGDGVLDALFPNQLDESLSVWWGVRGDFPAVRTDVKIGRSHRAPAVGDFDGDGQVDLVFGLPEAEAIGWLHALANRTFSKLRSTFQGPAVKYLALADENRDGRLDLYIRTVGGFLDVRRSQADGWASGRLVTMLGEGSELAMARTGGPIPLLYTSTGTGTDSEVHIREGDGRLRSSWPGIQRWVPSPDDASGDAYGISRLGAVVRVAADGTTCKVGPENNTYRMFAVGDMNGDGLLDGLSTLTCRFCTSNHVFLRGVGEERKGQSGSGPPARPTP